MTGMLVASAFACVFADALMSATSGAEVLPACTLWECGVPTVRFTLQPQALGALRLRGAA